MPLIEVHAFEDRFDDPEKSRELTARLTEAMTEVYGESVRAFDLGDPPRDPEDPVEFRRGRAPVANYKPPGDITICISR
jgi:hypothetical protein